MPDDSTTTETRAAWLSTSEAAAALGVSERTIQRRANAGKLTARKVTTGDGEKWEICLGADSAANRVPTGAAKGGATLNERESAPVATQSGLGAATGAKGVPTGADKGDATSETMFLRAQLDAMNAALEREQQAHEQTRQLLAGALQLHARQLPNATPQSAPEEPGAAQKDTKRTVTPESAREPRPLWKVILGIR